MNLSFEYVVIVSPWKAVELLYDFVEERFWLFPSSASGWANLLLWRAGTLYMVWWWWWWWWRSWGSEGDWFMCNFLSSSSFSNSFAFLLDKGQNVKPCHLLLPWYSTVWQSGEREFQLFSTSVPLSSSTKLVGTSKTF